MIADVRANGTPTDWPRLLSPESEAQLLQVKGSGRCGGADAKLSPETRTGLVRDGAKRAAHANIKFVFISTIGDKIGACARPPSTQRQRDRRLRPVPRRAEEVSSLDEVTDEAIAKELSAMWVRPAADGADEQVLRLPGGPQAKATQASARRRR